MKLISKEEKLELIDELEKYKMFFRTFWSVSDVYLTDQIPTACVQLVNDKFCFLFNPEFWNRGGIKFKLFIIAHEQLHIMLNHFERMRFEQGDGQNKNKAADISINHHIVRNFDIDRDADIPDWQNYCWVETMFPDHPNMPDNESVEFYYAQLKTHQTGQDQQTLDDHEKTYESLFGEGGASDELKEAIGKAAKEYVDQITEGMTDEEKADKLGEVSKDLEKAVERMAGSGFGGGEMFHSATVKPKKNWKKLYKKIPKRILSDRLQPHWISTERRYTMLPSDLMLPSDVELPREDKVIVHVYLDTSGSCKEDATYFLETALTLDPKHFTVEIFGFSDRIYDIPNQPPYRLRGFGGTSFQAISDHVDQRKQVDAVFVFTDGYAPMAHPKDPHKWFWFVLPDGTFDLIHPKCHRYDLSQYNWR